MPSIIFNEQHSSPDTIWLAGLTYVIFAASDAEGDTPALPERLQISGELICRNTSYAVDFTTPLVMSEVFFHYEDGVVDTVFRQNENAGDNFVQAHIAWIQPDGDVQVIRHVS